MTNPVAFGLLPSRRRSPLLNWVAGLVSLLLTGGCATRRPSPLVIQNGCTAVPVAFWNSSSVDLRLVSFNIWGLPGWMSGASPDRYPRIAQELARLEPDVVVLQEVWTDRARQALPKGEQWFIAWGSCPKSFFQQNGLVTISRHPIVGGRFYPFRTAAFPDSLVKKGVLKTTIEWAGGRLLNIWNVHLQAGNAEKVRLAQISELIGWVRSAHDGQLADVVAGDFNSIPGSAEYEWLVKQVGPTAQGIGRSVPFTTYDGLSSKQSEWQTLDHIFIRAQPAVDQVRASSRVAFTAKNLKDRLSDHFGVNARLGFELVPDVDSMPLRDALAAHDRESVFR